MIQVDEKKNPLTYRFGLNEKLLVTLISNIIAY